MKQFLVKTREIYINQNKKNNLCDTFVYEPSNIEEERLGNLYITGQSNYESDSKDESLSYLVNLLASVIKREYYSDSKRPPLKSLELALKKANATLNNLVEIGNADWVGNLHFISGCLSQDSLHLTCTGEAKGILLRNGALTDIGEIIPTLGSSRISPFKTFTSIASGKIEEGDLIIFSTPAFFEIIKTEELKSLNLESSIDEISQKIQEMLEEELNKKDLSLGMILLKIESPQKEIQAKGQKGFYEAQMKFIQEPPERKQREELKVYGEQKNKFLKDGLALIVFILEKLSLFIAKYLVKGGKFLKIIFLWGLQKLISFLIVGSSKVVRALPWPKLKNIKIVKPRFFKRVAFIVFKKLQINRLPNSARILLAISILLAILLGISLGVIYKKRAFELNLKQYDELLERAYQKENQAEAALIYDDLVKARILLAEAKEFAEAVLSGTDYFEKETEILLARIEKQGGGVDKIVSLPEPKLISDFSEKSDFIPQQIIGLGNGLYILDKEFSFYRLDLKSFESLKLEISFSGVGHPKDGAAIKNKFIVFYTDSPGIAIFDEGGTEIQPVDTSSWQSSLSQEIKEIAEYYGNIYLLDLERNQILKSYTILEGYSNPRPWLKEEADLEKACCFAIDGAIYILSKEGEISKYLQGKSVEFKNPQFFNPLKKTTKIFTTPAFRNLYIVDQEGRKVVVIDKIGNLVKQYFSEKFDDLKDVYVSSDESRIFLLNGEKVYQIDQSL